MKAGVFSMKIFAPDYYKDFCCIAGNCRHSCCIGWEIEIDSETAGFYKKVPGPFGEKLRGNIDFNENGGIFRLCEKERCPFLNKNGLCDIIINLGEDSLCQICSDHPRFRNFYESRTEIGLGLCCEEAARLVLEKTGKTSLIEIGEDENSGFPSSEEDLFFSFRKKIFDIIQNRKKSIEERISEAFELFGKRILEINFSEWAENFSGLERLDEEWTRILEYIKKNPAPPEIKDEIAAEQLLFYFIFRHFSIDEPEVSFVFSILCFYMTEKAAEKNGLLDSARLFSSEIEYSDENKDLVLDMIFEKGVLL